MKNDDVKTAKKLEVSEFDTSSEMVAGAGFEPTAFGLWARRATRLLHPAIFNLYASEIHSTSLLCSVKIKNQVL